MRGAHIESGHLRPGLGIIPADAGSTTNSRFPTGTKWDHPRGCGEHYNAEDTLPGVEGSSPRMRGAPMETSADLNVPGIIPADAGSTKDIIFQGVEVTDHPRGCGEHNLRRSHITFH